MKLTKRIMAVILALCMMTGILAIVAACNKDCGIGNHTDENHDGVCDVCGKASSFKHVDANGDKVCDVCNTKITYTYNTYASSFPAYWNPLDYETSDASSILSYGSSGFYEFDFAFDSNGQIIDGQFEIKPVMAAGLPVDVTSQYIGEEWGIIQGEDEEEAPKERAWKITLRDDLRWDDGTPITAESFIFSMKAQLDPQFKNLRADSYYNTLGIHNAKNYYFQGDKGWYPASTPYDTYDESLDSALVFHLGAAETATGNALSFIHTWPGGGANTSATAIINFLINNYGLPATLEEVLALENKTVAAIKADATLNETFEALIEWWEEGDDGILHFCVTEYTWPEFSFDNVGLLKVEGENALIVIMDTALSWGENGYHFAYEFGLPLVKEDVWNANKVEPQPGSTKWTSTYGTSVATTPSYGPYKLTVFEPGKQYVFERNTNWWGYGMEQYKGQYQTDKIVCDWVANWQSAWMSFQQGNLSAVSIDVSIADTYKTSSQAYFTPDDFVSTLQIQSSAEALVDPDDGNAKELLLNQNFRKAISLAFNRQEYAQTCTTSSQPGFGLFNSMHYYDVEHGMRYRDEDVAKRALCATYGIDVSKYASLDDAYEAITGYDITEARRLAKLAIQEELDAGRIKSTDKLELVLGDAAFSEGGQRVYEFLQNALKSMLEGTSFTGNKFSLTWDNQHGDYYANHFKQGQFDFLFAGWSGAAWDPFYFISAYTDPSYRYAQGWDPDSAEITITVKSFDFGDGSHTETLSVTEWVACINGWMDEAPYNMDEGVATTEDRLIVLGALEQTVLETYFSVPVSYYFSAALRAYKVKAVTNSYNTFMGWGGVQYYTYNYDDTEWAAFVAENGGTLDYNK